MSSRPSAKSTDQSLRNLVDAIVAGDRGRFSHLLTGDPMLARASFTQGATRQTPDRFIEAIGHYIYAGDTALHFAAGAYRPELARELIRAGAGVRAKNRRGTEPLHAAAVGAPGSAHWNPQAQAATIAQLIDAGAEPNAMNMDGATPLHRAVRTRCASAVHALLKRGADPSIKNKNGSTAGQLATRTTGRGGSGSPAAKQQQEEILLLLKGRQ